jgi:hypothetical protein
MYMCDIIIKNLYLKKEGLTMNKKQNPLGIRDGDVVEIFFDHYPSSRGAFHAKVTEVTDCTMMGSDACIAYVPDESARELEKEALGIPYECSVSHVRAIVLRAPYKQDVYRSPHNIFRQDSEAAEARRMEEGRDAYWPGYYSVGNVRITFKSMGTLVELALAMAKDTLDRPYSLERFHTLWKRDGFRGKVMVPAVPELNGVYTHDELQESYAAVNWKAFKHYVLANRHRLLLSQREMEKAGAAFSKALWDSSFDDDKFPRGEGPDAYL